MLAVKQVLVNPLESYLRFFESRRGWVYAAAATLVAGIAYGDWKLEEISIGFLYVVPILLASATLRGWQIVVMAVGCGVLRECFNPLQGTPGALARVLIGTAGFALVGYFVAQLNRQRRSVAQHLQERERQMELRMSVERQLQAVIETSPLGIVTLDHEGRVALANTAAQHLFRLEEPSLSGQEIHRYLPILKRFVTIQHSAQNLRTAVESRGQRVDGEAFLAHVWLSTFDGRSGPCLAAFIWDASESVREREGSGLDSLMATSRVVIGAISHEIRNLAAAASAAHKELAREFASSRAEGFHALGAVIEALESIATSGLRLASHFSKGVADLGMVLDEARVLIDASLRERGGVTHWNIPDALPLVEADHHGLLQVLLNLARNSETAMKNAPRKALYVEAAVENDLVLVQFHDTGPGIADPEKLFKAFQSGAASTGLGLYISRAVVKSYGGDLRHKPTADGSCFEIQLWRADDASAH